MTDLGGSTTPSSGETSLARRVDQSITDFKFLVHQMFDDLNLRLDERDKRQTGQLDERFKTQTTVLDAAFSAAEKARQEALLTTQEASTRTDIRIKVLEDRMNTHGARSVGRADVWGWVVAGVAVVGALATLFLR